MSSDNPLDGLNTFFFWVFAFAVMGLCCFVWTLFNIVVWLMNNVTINIG